MDESSSQKRATIEYRDKSENDQAGWYLYADATPDNSQQETMLGPSSAVQIRDHLRDQLGGDATARIDAAMENAITRHVQRKARDYDRDPTPSNFDNLTAATDRATAARRALERNDPQRETVLVTRNGNIRPPVVNGNPTPAQGAHARTELQQSSQRTAER